MRSPNSLSLLALVALGVSFAAANLWFAAARSTIPLQLRGKVTEKQLLIEKAPGVDDVYLVTIDSRQRIQVDGPVFDAMAQNESVSKQAWQRSIDVGGRNIALSWSPDFYGMLWAMPLSAVVCAVLGMTRIKCRRRDFDEPCDARESELSV